MKKSLLFHSLILSLITFSIQAQQISYTPPMAQPKLKLGLAQVATLANNNQVIDAGNVRNYELFQFKEVNKKILVDVIAKGEVANLQKELSASTIEMIGFSKKRITCWIETDKINSLVNASRNISWIQPVIKPLNNSGPVMSQGDSAQRSGIARQMTGLNGTGVKIGVLSDSYNLLGGANAGVSAGELPGTDNPNGFTTPVTVLSESLSGGADEGRAMIEIIHDVAPGAQLYYYSAYNGEADFANGIRALAAAGCKIIVDDITYLLEPFFQDGLIAQAVDEVAANYGVSYYSSAGNSINSSYEAPYQSSTFQPFINSTETAHNFGTAGSPVYLLPIQVIGSMTMTLEWDDPYFSTGNGSAGATSDLEIYLLIQSGGNYQVVASSNESNIGADPAELFGVNGSGTAYILITKKAGTNPRNIKFVGFRGLSWSITPTTIAGIKASTIIGHHNATNTIAVGAASYDQTPAYGVNPPLPESYTSRGGTPIYRSISGDLLPTPVVRAKPEIVAPDNANTSFFIAGYDYESDGKPNFNGTSAAAPHAAAVAGLMLQGNPGLTPGAIKTALINSCVDMDDPSTPGFDTGFDYATGNGLIRADAAVLSTLNPNCPTVNVTITRPTTFCEGDSVILDANTASGYSFQWKRNNTDLPQQTQARLIVKESGLYTVAITNLNCTLSSTAIRVTSKLGVPAPVTVSRTISQGTVITTGNGLQANSNCHPQQTATYTGPTVGYDNGTKNGPDPTATIAGVNGNITLIRISVRWRKRSGGTINDCGTTGGNSNPFNDEVSFKIIAPDNTTINLLNANTYSFYGSYVGTVTTIFEDGGAAVGTIPASGTFNPAQSLELLNGKNPNGTWKLIANDDAAADPLCVEGFSITVYTNGSGVASTITWWDSQSGGSQLGTGNEYIPGNTSPGTYTYYAEAACAGSGLSCQTSIRVPASLTIIPGCVTQAGTVNGNTNVCAGSNSGTLTLSGHIGTVLRWESSVDNFATITTINNTTTTQNYSGLTQNTQFRAVVKNGACVEANANPATITVTLINAIASNTGPYNVGQTIQLTASGGSSYSWTGPNAFNSNDNPATINGATITMAGTYTVTVTQNTCTATATTFVSVSDNNPCSKVVDFDYVLAGYPFDYKFPLVNNMVIAQVPEETSIILNPICPTVTIESFRMLLQGPAPFQNHETIESVPIYALFNNTSNNVLGRHLPVGNYTLTVTGYNQDNAQGSITYGPAVMNFNIIASNATIETPTFNINSLCAGGSNTFNVNFGTTGTFAIGNQFEVQLSDLYSSFDNPVVIGTSSTAGNVACTIPANVVAGNQYKIRVVSTNPTINSNSNGTTISITSSVLTLVSPNDNYTGATLIKTAGQTINATNKIFTPSNISYEAGNAVILGAGFQVDNNAVFRAEIKGCYN
ncbi:3-coathanger stack domain-containing protein [Emticicia sp. BO119]|uniref:3-coathanger stack domain-containing protein n=1 Tax=Emticicia sp. BO119 TaxID=2757768 RepID=UPI0015F027B5|nr:3-coathanger stack domain-containing protein [Emticicia sp. BO119]MBA4852957.1 S8 family serine peptidase [Emticicia sp. BO119]